MFGEKNIETKELSPMQIIFPDRRTLEEVINGLTNEIKELKTKIETLQSTAVAEGE